jgi:hypothetical protein
MLGANAKIYQLSGVQSEDEDNYDREEEEDDEEAMEDEDDDDLYRLGSASHYPVLQATRVMPVSVREEEIEEEDERMGDGGAAGRSDDESDEWAGN